MKINKINFLANWKKVFFLYSLYVFVFSYLVFYINPKTKETNINSINKIKDKNIVCNLITDRQDSFHIRLDMFKIAEKSINLAYYTIQQDDYTEIIFGALLNAANRGVKVNILLDGIFHNMGGNFKDISYILEKHPNINIKYYQKIKLFKPHSFNNRLHDKLIVVDENKALISGRNLGSRYFSNQYDNDKVVEDLDALIVGKNSPIIGKIEDYFNLLFNSDYSTNSITKLASKKLDKILDRKKDIIDKFSAYNYTSVLDSYMERSVPVDSIALIHNPITNGNKEPIVLKSLVSIANNSNTVHIQSPYIIPTVFMTRYINDLPKDIYAYTNSIEANPNPLAVAGYFFKRSQINSVVDKIYEYKGIGSIHGKAYVFDDNISAIGSFNFDNRSTFLSTESMILIEGKDFANKVLSHFDNLKSKSSIYKKQRFKLKPFTLVRSYIIMVLSILTKLLNIML